MPRYVAYSETRIVKQAIVRDIEAPNVQAAMEEAKRRVKKNDVEWGNAEVESEFVNIEEQK